MGLRVEGAQGVRGGPRTAGVNAREVKVRKVRMVCARMLRTFIKLVNLGSLG